MMYRCELCGQKLEPHGTAGLACPDGHHFLAADVARSQPTLAQVGRMRFMARPWLPGAVLGGLGLVVALADLAVILF